MQLILIPFLLLVLIALPPIVRAYEKIQLDDCISSARGNASIEGVSESSIKKYCDCALDLIVDQRQDVRESGYECALKSFK